MGDSQLFVKDPDAVLDYEVDWSSWLDGDTISASSWTVSAGITQVSASFTTTTATIWVSGGTVGTTYTLTNRVVTTAGRTDDRRIMIEIEER